MAVKETSLKRKLELAESFKKNGFWRRVMKPAVEVALAEHLTLLRTCKPEELEGLQKSMDVIEMYLEFPDLIINECETNLGFEAMGQEEGDEDE